MHFVLIVNPISGRGRSEAYATRFRNALRERGCSCTVRITEKEGDAEQFASEVHPDDRLICVGGDGTVNEVLNGISLADPPVLLVCPMGTGNVIAGEYRTPALLEKQVQLAVSNRVRWVDVGMYGEQRFLAMAGLGFDGAIVHRFHEARGDQTHMARYVGTGIATYLQFEAVPMKVTVDQQKQTEQAYFLQIAVVRNYGGPLIFSPDARHNDGQFAVSWLSSPSKWDLFELCMLATMGSPHLHPSYHTVAGQTVDVSPSTTPLIQLDGDPVGFQGNTFRIVPRTIPVLSPLVPSTKT